MKKIMLFVVAILTIVVVSGCSQIQSIVKTQLSSASSLATLSYVSSSFLDTNVGEEPTAASFYQLNDENLDTETELDSELDEVNIYLDKLKVFIENGTDSFGNIVVQESDNELYNNKIVFTINEEEYILYYNVQLTDGTIVGEFVIGDTTYEIEGYTTLNDMDEMEVNNEEDQDDEDQDDLDTEDQDDLDTEDQDDLDTEDQDDLDTEDQEEQEEQEEKMVLIARNGDNVIQITYEIETDEEGYESKFELEQTINGEYKEITLKIEEEQDEYKIQINEGANSFTFKRELEDDNETEYKLEYEVNGVEGEVKITESLNEAGETVYIYEIDEEGTHVERENERPASRGFDDEEEQEDESSDSNEL